MKNMSVKIKKNFSIIRYIDHTTIEHQRCQKPPARKFKEENMFFVPNFLILLAPHNIEKLSEDRNRLLELAVEHSQSLRRSSYRLS